MYSIRLLHCKLSPIRSQAPRHPAVETERVLEKDEKKSYNVKVAVQEVNGVLYRKTPPASARPPPMVVHKHEDFAHHEASDRRALRRTLTRSPRPLIPRLMNISIS